MKINYTAIGIFVVSALVLLTVGLFLIGDRHKAFSHHENLFTELADVNGVAPGTKVRVAGYEAGQVTEIKVPDRPSGKFRLKLHLDSKLHDLIREDSQVSVESDGLVGDKFLMIHPGTDSALEANSGSTLKAREPIELSAVIEKATGIIDQANATIGDLRGKLDGTLDDLKSTVNNTNGLVSDARHGKGSVGMLLNDQATANKVRDVVNNADQASSNLNQVSVQARQVVTDFQQRDLFKKTEDTLNNAKDASLQLDQTTKQVNATLNDAFGPDRTGATAGENLRETLSNVNLATANVADDTEALKHEFLFRGFFKKRGYYSLAELTPEQYRTSKYFQDPKNHRAWLNASDAFTKDSNGNEILSEAGKMQIDQVVGSEKDWITNRPIVVEGYSDNSSGATEMTESRSRSLLVRHYLEKRFHLSAKNIGVMPLNSTAPAGSGKSSWNGASIVLIADAK